MSIDTDFFLLSIGIICISLQLVLGWQYKDSDYFKTNSYYMGLLKIKKDRPLYGLTIIILFYLSIAVIAVLFAKNIWR